MMLGLSIRRIYDSQILRALFYCKALVFGFLNVKKKTFGSSSDLRNYCF